MHRNARKHHPTTVLTLRKERGTQHTIHSQEVLDPFRGLEIPGETTVGRQLGVDLGAVHARGYGAVCDLRRYVDAGGRWSMSALLCVDERGVVSCRWGPPSDILIPKRITQRIRLAVSKASEGCRCAHGAQSDAFVAGEIVGAEEASGHLAHDFLSFEGAEEGFARGARCGAAVSAECHFGC